MHPLAAAINAWYASSGRDLPWRHADASPWAILLSEVMLQQTPVNRVLPAWTAWMARWPTPTDLAAVPPGEAVRAWQRLGYPRRALRLHECASAIVESHGGEVPADVDALLALPGIGDYTARAVAVFAFGQRHPVVDTNVRRVIARAVDGNAEPAPPASRRDRAATEALLPESPADAKTFSVAIMELGALVCTARVARCGDCPVAALCAWRTAGFPAYDGPRRAVQAKYQGSDRQVRGLVLRELRASHRPVTDAELAPLWTDAAQLVRAVDGLIADGLAVRAGDGLALP